MPQEIKAITLFGVNCYLVKTSSGYILIDTGWPFKRADLDKELEGAGCKPGNLELIILTHGDFDHSGNAAHLRDKYGARIAAHRRESEMVETGDIMHDRPALHSLTDDAADLKASVEKVKGLGVKRVYPGHGSAFSAELLAGC